MSEYLNDKMPVRVGIVDDHKSVTIGIFLLLNSMRDIHAVLKAYSGEELLDLLKTSTELPDILLMDIELSGMSGIDTTKEVTALYPTIKVIAYSSLADDWTIVKMISSGACAYLSKHMMPETMEEAIHEVHRKGKYQADLYYPHSAELRRYGKEMEMLVFSDKELRYLQLLCKGYLWETIANEMKKSVKAVHYYSTCVSKKLNTNSQAQTLLAALRLGIVTLEKDKKRNH